MRQPLALSNWKMAMTIGEGREYVARFLAAAGDLPERVEVILCPPCTALHAVGQALVGPHTSSAELQRGAWHAHPTQQNSCGKPLAGQPVSLGAQNVSAHEAAAHTGEVSARLLADAGCRWVLLGHWEVRRNLGDGDALVNRKVRRALDAGLRPLLAVGEATGREATAADDLVQQLPVLLDGCTAAEVRSMAFLYEPEWTIGRTEPAPLAHVQAGCRAIRLWLGESYGPEAADAVRIIYGGSVSLAYAAQLLQALDVDGLGAARRSRDPQTWAAIVRLIAEVKCAGRDGDGVHHQ